MSLIQLDLSGIVDGAVAEAADLTNAFGIIVNDYNGNITNDNIAASAGIVLSKLAQSAWTTFSPTWSNLTVNNGTVTAAYTQVGKGIMFYINLVFGSTTSISGQFSATLPASIKDYGFGSAKAPIATVWYEDASNTNVMGTGAVTSAGGDLVFYCWNHGATYVSSVAVSATVPFTFGTGDSITAIGQFEAQ